MVFLINDAGTADKIGLVSYTIYQNKLQKDLRSKRKKKINKKQKNIQILEENMSEFFHNQGRGNAELT